MARWAKIKGGRNWHWTLATSTDRFRASACGNLLEPEVVLDGGALPPEKEVWCFHCYEVYWRGLIEEKERKVFE